MADGGGGPILQIQTEGEGQMLGMHSGPDGWVPGSAPTYPEQDRLGTPVGRKPAIGGPTYVLGLVYTDGGVGGTNSKGLQMRGE